MKNTEKAVLLCDGAVYADGDTLRTPAFRSASEAVQIRVSGRCAPGSEPVCRVCCTKADGTTEEVLTFPIRPADRHGNFLLINRFDAASLAVYQHAETVFLTFSREVEQIADWNAVELPREAGRYEPTADVETFAVRDDGSRAVEICDPDGNSLCLAPVIPQKVLFMGNSILLGMCNAFGMCASDNEHDYYHLVSSAIRKHNPNAEFRKLHGSGLEHAETFDAVRAYWQTAPNIYTGAPAKESFTPDLDLIVIQLGDNVNTDEKERVFTENLGLYLRTVRKACPRARMIWVHGWYNRGRIDGVLTELCRRFRIPLIDVFDIRSKETESRAGAAYRTPDGEVLTVSDNWITHPGDLGMARIAERILNVLDLG